MVLRQLSGVGVGVVAAAIGLLPWLLAGSRLPIQNLWATDVTSADQMPFVLLPFSQYAVVLIVAVVLTGAAVAGFAVRLLRGRRVGIVVGLLIAEVVAIVQSATVDGSGLEQTPFARLYLVLLVSVAVLSLLLGVVVLVLIGFAPRAGLVLGVAVAAVPFESWLGGLLIPFGSFSVAPVVSLLLEPVRFVPAVAVASAIVWAGLRSVGRVIAALLALPTIWVGPALVTGVVNSAGTRVYAHDPAAMLEAGRSVFVLALLSADVVVPPLAVALALIVLGVAVRTILRRRRTAAAAGVRTPPERV